MDVTTRRLEYMICVRDQEIAALRGALVIEHLRRLQKASASAIFNPGPMTFTEPPETATGVTTTRPMDAPPEP